MEKTPFTYNEMEQIANALLPKDDYYISYNVKYIEMTYIITLFGTIFIISKSNPFGEDKFISANNQNVVVISIKGIDKLLEHKNTMPFEWLVGLYIEEYE